jgi:hypothetical protein
VRRGLAHNWPPAERAPASRCIASAHAAWKALQKAGGLVGSRDLRQRWGTPEEPLRRQTVHKLNSQEDFLSPSSTAVEERPTTGWPPTLTSGAGSTTPDHDAAPKPRRPTRDDR